MSRQAVRRAMARTSRGGTPIGNKDQRHHALRAHRVARRPHRPYTGIARPAGPYRRIQRFHTVKVSLYWQQHVASGRVSHERRPAHSRDKPSVSRQHTPHQSLLAHVRRTGHPNGPPVRHRRYRRNSGRHHTHIQHGWRGTTGTHPGKPESHDKEGRIHPGRERYFL